MCLYLSHCKFYHTRDVTCYEHRNDAPTPTYLYQAKFKQQIQSLKVFDKKLLIFQLITGQLCAVRHHMIG